MRAALRAATAPAAVPAAKAPPAPRAAAIGGARLWTASSLAVFTLHAGALALAVLWTPSPDMAPPPPAAMMIELAPMAAPPTPPTDKAPGIEQQAAKPVEQEQKQEPPPRKAEVELPKPKPKPKPKPVQKPVEEAPVAEKVVEQTTAPIAAPAAPSPKMAAPAPGASVAAPSNAVPTWQGTLRAHLERHKRYPAAAQFRRQQGVAHVRFAMNRDGAVLWARLERGSGHDRLDDESLALMERAQPLPPPPPEIPGEPIEIVVPIQFFLK